MGLFGKKDAEEDVDKQFAQQSSSYRLPKEDDKEGSSSGCCSKANAHEKLEQFETRDLKRKPTDVIWFITIVVLWIATTIRGGMVAHTAKPSALIHPSDYTGKICGIDSGVVNKPYGYYINMNLDMVCVKSCPSKTKTLNLNNNAYDNMICKSSEVGDSYKSATETSSKYYDYEGLFDSGEGSCNFEIESYAVLYWCIFDFDAVLPNISSSEVNFVDDENADYFTGNYKIKKLFGITDSGSSGYMMEFMQDVYTCRAQIFGFGLAVALFLAFLYTFLLTLGVTYCIVWGSVVFTLATILGLGGYMYNTSQEWDGDGTHSVAAVTGMEVMGIVFLCMAALYLCLLICICGKINLSCELVNVAGKCVRDIPAVVFFPVLKLAGLLCFLAPWLYFMICLYSQGSYDVEINSVDDPALTCIDCTNTTKIKNWEWSDVNLEDEIFFMFSYFWTSEFITALGQLIMALVFSSWYFTEDPSQEVEVDVTEGEGSAKKRGPHYRGNLLFFKAICGGIWYHAGTAAFGSLIIAVIKLIRYILYKIQAQCNKTLTGCAKRVANVVLCCIQCCLYCLEKCMKYINKHAYIITAVRGSSFCPAAMQAFWLIARNIRLIFALTLVSEYVILIGKVCIVFGAACLSYIYMGSVFHEEVNSLLGPTFMVMVLAYFTADMFMVVYSMAIDTMLHCYIADKEMHEHPYFSRESCTHLGQLHKKVHKYKIKEKNEKEEPLKADDDGADDDES